MLVGDYSVGIGYIQGPVTTIKGEQYVSLNFGSLSIFSKELFKNSNGQRSDYKFHN